MCVCVCVYVRVCEKAKLIQGDPTKIALKGRVSPPKRKIWPLQKYAAFHFEGTILFFSITSFHRFNRAAVLQKIRKSEIYSEISTRLSP